MVKIQRRVEEAQDEVKQRAEEVVRVLNKQPREHWEQTATWLDVVAQWERAETMLYGDEDWEAAAAAALEIVVPETRRDLHVWGGDCHGLFPRCMRRFPLPLGCCCCWQ